MTETKPEGYENDLGKYGACIFDSHCGEPIMWGFPIVCQLGKERFDALYDYGWLECLGKGSWFLIKKKLTHDEAVEKYGKVTNIDLGPRGGFRSITFGDKEFLARQLYTQ